MSITLIIDIALSALCIVGFFHGKNQVLSFGSASKWMLFAAATHAHNVAVLRDSFRNKWAAMTMSTNVVSLLLMAFFGLWIALTVSVVMLVITSVYGYWVTKRHNISVSLNDQYLPGVIRYGK